MKCPKCGGRSEVIDGRRSASYGVRRRRECRDCKHRWSTVEVMCPERQLARAVKIYEHGSDLADLLITHIDNLSEMVDNLKQSLKEYK